MKSAVYIEQTSKKDGKKLYWAGYVYADKEVDAKDYTFVKNSFDQWGKEVKVYKASEKTYIGTPGGTKGSDLVVLF